jgi:PBP1b-binding outer membrane lipoprotein LpoB
MRYIMGVLAILFAIFTLSGCSSKVETSMINHKKGDAKIYFYRDATSASSPAAIVFVNGRITGIVKPNQYIETNVCYGKVTASIKTKIGNRLASNTIALDVSSDNNSTLFVRLYDTSSGVKAQNVTPDEDILDGKHYGENAINRYIPRCPNRR